MREERSGDDVEEDVDCVEAILVCAVQQVVEAEGEHGERSVRLVRTAVCERGAPKVVA